MTTENKKQVVQKFIDQFFYEHEYFCLFLEFNQRWSDRGKMDDLVNEIADFGYDNYDWFEYDYCFTYILEQEGKRIPNHERLKLYQERKMRHFTEYLESLG